MPWARVVQRRISVADSSSRLPVPYFEGDKVKLNQADFKRLSAAGAVEAAGDSPDDDDTDTDTDVDLSPVEADQVAHRLAKKTAAELDDLAAENGLTLPDGTKQEKAAYLAEMGVTGG